MMTRRAETFIAPPGGANAHPERSQALGFSGRLRVRSVPAMVTHAIRFTNFGSSGNGLETLAAEYWKWKDSKLKEWR